MRKVVLVILLFLSAITSVNAQKTTDKDIIEVDEKPIIDIKWEASFKDALIKARKEKKPILLYFTGSDWCGPCKRLDANLFHTAKFKNLSDEKMVLYTADFPRNKDLVLPANRKINKELSARYGQTSFPTVIMIDEKGEVLGRKNGIYMIEYYYPFFESALRRYK